MNYEDIFNENTIKAIRKLTDGMVVKETTEEFVADDNGELKLVKKKVNAKTLPPNTDIIKMIYNNTKDETSIYKTMSDEELEQEKLRLIKQIREEEKNGNTEYENEG